MNSATDAEGRDTALLDVGAVVVGAGPAGLAAAACLKRVGVHAVVLDRAAEIGASWRRHYDRLRLHTARDYSGLPGLPMPEEYPIYPSRAEVVSYLENYCAAMSIEPRLGVDVRSASPDSGRWRIALANGGGYVASSLVVASGYNAEPLRPAWPGSETFAGPIVHSCDYKNGRAWAGKTVLVVGSGNSGAEIAIDLWESDAKVTMSIRGPIHVVPRDAFGIALQRMAIQLARVPARVADRLSKPLRDLVIGDLTPYGIKSPIVGPLELLETAGRVAVIDIGTVALIKQRAIRIAPNIAKIESDSVVFSDGTRAPCDAIVLATGYRAALDRWIHLSPTDAEAVFDARGLPRKHGAEVVTATLRGLYFLGFRNPSTGNLREIGLEAERIARCHGRGHAPDHGQASQH